MIALPGLGFVVIVVFALQFSTLNQWTLSDQIPGIPQQELILQIYDTLSAVKPDHLAVNGRLYSSVDKFFGDQ